MSLEIFRLVGEQVPGQRKPPEWSSVVISALGAGGFAYWTYTLSASGFNSWSILTGGLAFFFFAGGVWGGLFPGRVTEEEVQTTAAATQAGGQESPSSGGSESRPA